MLETLSLQMWIPILHLLNLGKLFQVPAYRLLGRGQQNLGCRWRGMQLSQDTISVGAPLSTLQYAA